MAHPWEQQSRETVKAYKAFSVYRDLGRERSVTAAYWKVTGRVNAEQAAGGWQMWAAKNDWIARAIAYDAHQDHLRLATRDQAIVDVVRESATEYEISQERTLRHAAYLAYSELTDVVSWDEERISVTPSAELPAHVKAAIQEVSEIYDDKGRRRQLKVKMHAKSPSLDLLGQKFSLWGRSQAEEGKGGTYLQMLNVIMSGQADEIIERVLGVKLPPLPQQIKGEEE